MLRFQDRCKFSVWYILNPWNRSPVCWRFDQHGVHPVLFRSCLWVFDKRTRGLSSRVNTSNNISRLWLQFCWKCFHSLLQNMQEHTASCKVRGTPFLRILFLRLKLTILIFLPILGWKYSCEYFGAILQPLKPYLMHISYCTNDISIEYGDSAIFCCFLVVSQFRRKGRILCSLLKKTKANSKCCYLKKWP